MWRGMLRKASRFRSLVVAVLGFLVLSGRTAYGAEFEQVTDVYKDIGIVQCAKYLNIRQSPKPTGEIIGLIPNNGVCQVLQEGETWCAIKSGDIRGYVLKEYLVFGDEAYKLAEATATMKVQLLDAGIIYASTSTDSNVWERPGIGATYDVIQDYGDWLEVDLYGTSGYLQVSDGVRCYMGLREATHTYNVKNVSGVRQEMVKYAMQFLGNQYVWGGNDPHTGADCSGFVKYVYNKYRPDITLPRTSYTQCYCGERVSSLDMKPGDLLFYAYDNGTVHHVAMYIGNGTIIHAASRRQGVILSAWNYQTPKYIRNILGD